jgi:HAD superfamily, subfamily IIIB (Acid phosphatase)
MTRTPAGTSTATEAKQGRLRRSAPVIAGSVIAAVGLAFGSVGLASAQAAHHSPPPTIEQQAAKVKAEDAYTPVDGNKELNVNVLEDQVVNYYGTASATFPGVGTVTVPSKTSNYAKQMNRIVARAAAYLAKIAHTYHGKGKPAVVFDIDDTLLNTYDYTLAQQFGFDPATNLTYIDDAAFPAVFHMPQLVSFAAKHGFSIFYITGRPQSQTAATVKDLTSAGYSAPADGHLFLKPATPPSYLHCAKAPTCTTTEYKSGTRKYISSLGYTILADFGDQYSDLLGGDAGHQVKIPNPMYYLP